MHPEAYRELAAQEERGWYYQARVSAVKNLIRSFAPAQKSLSILDIGAGTGGSTQQWRVFGDVIGVEPSPMARQLLSEKFPDLKVLAGGTDDLPQMLPTQKFAVIIILGVLYHQSITDPGATIKLCSQFLKPGGILIINEAAFPALMRQHDRLVMGARRFLPSELRRYLNDAGLKVVSGAPLLAWAYPIARFAAWRDQRSNNINPPAASPDDQPLPRWLNSLLYIVTLAEWLFSRYVYALPIGVSYLVVGKKDH